MTLDPKPIKTMENKQLKYKFTGKDLKQITESISKKVKLDEKINQDWRNSPFEMHFSMNGMRDAVGGSSLPELVNYAKTLKNIRNLAIYRHGVKSTADENYLVAWWGDGSYWDNRSVNEKNIAAKKIKELFPVDESLNEGDEETFDFDFEDKIDVAPTKETDVEPGQELLLDEEMDYNKLKTVGKTIMKQILTLRSEILDSKYDESVVKILKNIEKLAEELSNYEYKNSTPEEKTKSVEQAFESKI